MTGSSFNLIILVAGLAFLPLLAVAVTAFTKFSVVIFIIRNALGIQQLPPNIVVYSLSVIMAAYIAAPMLSDAYRAVDQGGFSFSKFQDYEDASTLAALPLKSFLSRNTDSSQVAFFVQSAQKLWPKSSGLTAKADDLTVMVPAFLLSQLTSAFEIGFLLYLPFLAIDIVVTSILVALGMMMVPPNTISIPFKLMLFVFVEGWTRLIQGMILTYT